MITGFEAFALAATDINYMSREAKKIITPLAQVSSELGRDGAVMNPDVVREALDKITQSIGNVDRKLAECTNIITSMASFDLDNKEGIIFDLNFPVELKSRAEVMSDVIENLKSVFSIVESSFSWKPYLYMIQPYKVKSIRALSSVRNAYLNMARIAEQHTSPVSAAESTVTGDVSEFHKAVAASSQLIGLRKADWS